MIIRKKIIRITTVPVSLEKLIEGQLAFMQQYYDVIAVSSDKQRLEEIGAIEGVRTYAVGLTRQITLGKDLLALWKLYRYFKRERPLIVHSHTPKAGTVSMLAARLAGVPNRLHTIAGLPLLESTGLKRILLNFVERVTYSCATKIYPNSTELKNIIIQKKFCPPNKLKVIANGSSNGVNTDYFNVEQISKEAKEKLRNELHLKEDDFVFIFVGRLVGDKGINEIVSAFHRLRVKKNVKLLLVGPFETDLYPLSTKTLLEISQNKNIITVGYQNDVRPYFAICNIGLLPSYREGFPNVVMQAGAMGLPCIVSNINGCNEIIINEENGLIIPAKDANALHSAMGRVYEDEKLRANLEYKSRKLIISRFEQEIVWQAILDEYRSLEFKLPTIIRTSTISMSLDILLKGQLAYLGNFYDVLAVSGEDVHLKNIATREKVRTANVHMNRTISPFEDLISLVNLFSIFRREKPLLVHSMTPKAGLLSMFAAYFAGVPIRVHTFTGLIFPYKTGFLHYLLLIMDKILCKFATHIFPEGEGVKNDMLKFRITCKPLHVLANGNVNGIDVDYFNASHVPDAQKNSLKDELQIEPNDFVFVFIGRMVTDKGIDELISAFSTFSATYTDCKLLLIGPFEHELDPLKKSTLTEIDENENIISVGYQTDVRQYFAISDVSVLPSYREGFPNVVMQAGAMGLPSIVSDINGCNEIIKDGENGIIIPAKDSSALFQAMKRMYDDKALRDILKQNARQMIVSRYEQKVVWDAILAEYKRLEKDVQKHN